VESEESDIERSFRRTLPQTWPRVALWTLAVFGVNYLHSLVMARIVRALPGKFVAEIYVNVAAALITTSTLFSLGGLLSCYYYALRERRVHTAMTETGLAFRAIIAGTLALGAFGAAYWLFLSGFDRR
jgi:hypothetical protein